MTSVIRGKTRSSVGGASFASNGRPGKSRFKYSRPSLVVLSPDQHMTSFQRRRYNPNELPEQVFTKFRTNPLTGTSPNENESDSDTQPQNDENGRPKFSYNDPNAYEEDEDGEYQTRKSSSSYHKPNIRPPPHADGFQGSDDEIYQGSVDFLSSEFQKEYNEEEDFSIPMDDESFDPFKDDDAATNATSNYSTFVDDENFENQFFRMLDLDPMKASFKPLFNNFPPQQRRQLGRVGRLQMVQKRKWISGIWSLFGDDDKEGLWATLRALVDDSDIKDAWAAGLLESAKKALDKFIVKDVGGLSFFMRAAIVGPEKSGKSSFFRVLLLQMLLFLARDSQFKSMFIVPLKLDEEFNSIESFYQNITSSVLNALIVERPDVELFTNSLTKAFATLLTAKKVKHLPKPISSQDYLRRPMGEMEQLLKRMHQCWNDPNLIDAFVTNLVVLPQTIGKIFGFNATIIVADHLDNADIELKYSKGKPPIQLFEFLKFGLLQTQYLISCVDSETFLEKMQALDDEAVDISLSTTLLSVYDVAAVQASHTDIDISFSNYPAQPKIVITEHHCGGCPRFVMMFDNLVNEIQAYEKISNSREKREKFVQLSKDASDFLGVLLDFSENDGEVPEIKKIEITPSTRDD